jgi:protein-S-isoprenylcysteine O-methyltransferase Ste14
MIVAILALALLAVWLGLIVGPKVFSHRRRTGTVPMPTRDRPGSPQWWAKLISSLGLLCAFAAPVADLLGLRPLVEVPLLWLAGLVLALLGITGTLVGQWAMGDSWRPDVDPEAHTALVVTGPFRLVRNPILTSTLATALGLAFIVPNLFAALMLVAFVTALEIQVRLAEEPHLLHVHGADYRRYASRTGRFVPWIGRLPDRSG